ncbi:hypothetical protein JMK10_12610 [Rhodovulum sulfidophilum]|uniref:hypothetical protein n=1 Tax=Rhodovulum sulfidophilum TaxID=35806 RepID=UPI001922BA6D|nr:hypothetical protein [Rhodovulum sulfidophilum]MBL3575239.1 hypothetical protein [Rhodovulum sulfidophilum]MCE8431042.1 hypothetical protein [Rhodovulum sulfidophilum]MCF4117637.1 hypothetical protein [Rhodovulum sulfidophilum]
MLSGQPFAVTADTNADAVDQSTAGVPFSGETAPRTVSSSLKPLGATNQATFAIALEPMAINGSSHFFRAHAGRGAMRLEILAQAHLNAWHSPV